jgi:peroxiredoxin
MVLTETPICNFGEPAPDFTLPGVDGRDWSLADCRGEAGTVVMFICNHCPYVRAIRARLIADVERLTRFGVKAVAIMPNDTDAYPEDGFDNMRAIARELAFPFPYLLDETQEVARAYGALCTPDFFGYNADLELQYRGRLDSGRLDEPPATAPRELLEAMRRIAETGRGPATQYPSVGCSIKWRATAG